MSQNDNKNNKVFISYAQEDTDAATRLYNDLKNFGLEPWLDKESILPGQFKSIESKRAIRESRFFIALISKNSVRERGDVQKQLRDALDILKEFPESEIFLIPARLDDCGIPFNEMEDMQYADLFPIWEDGVKRILQALKWKEIQRLAIAVDNNLSVNLSDVYWNELITLIDEKKCIPFIGPAASSPWISLRTLADKWMIDHDYPFDDPDAVKTHIGEEDSYKLARVTQFMAIKEANERFPKLALSQELSETLIEMDSPNFSLPEDHLCSVLASLDLPIYLTTNYDHLMEIALKKRKKEPKSEYCRWNDELDPISDESKAYEPTVSKPLVYHFHGDIKIPDSMVLTERDYFDFVIKLNVETDLLPTVIGNNLSPGSSFLFIGYSLQDINFRAIFQGALSSFNMRKRKSNRKTRTRVAVQIPPSFSNDPSISNDKKQRVVKYLDDYAKNMFEVHAYWGDMDDFVRQLRQKFEKRVKAAPTMSSTV